MSSEVVWEEGESGYAKVARIIGSREGTLKAVVTNDGQVCLSLVNDSGLVNAMWLREGLWDADIERILRALNGESDDTEFNRGQNAALHAIGEQLGLTICTHQSVKERVAELESKLAARDAEVGRCKQALQEIAANWLTDEMDEFGPAAADFEGAYDQCVKTARAAFAPEPAREQDGGGG